MRSRHFALRAIPCQAFHACMAILLVGLVQLSSTAACQTPAGQWAWMGGSKTACDQPCTPSYGTEYQFAPGNSPGQRSGAAHWTDSNGKMWLFGGSYFVQSSGFRMFNDLWEFDPAQGAHGEWAWMGGSNASPACVSGYCAVAGAYGVEYQFAEGNEPGGRYDAGSWVDAGGRLWIYGGVGEDSAGTAGFLDDLWVFDPAQGTHGEWAWMGGHKLIGCGELCARPVVYGAEYQFAAANSPGGRLVYVSWSDASGRFWLFEGGIELSFLMDLWVFDPSQGPHGEWAWMGTNPIQDAYGTEYEFGEGNFPAFRDSPVTWNDASGNLWLFGGISAGAGFGLYDDLWVFDAAEGAHGEWAWMGGNKGVSRHCLQNACGYPGVYGGKYMLRDFHMPGSREGGFGWIDGAGRSWLSGGYGFAAFGNFSFLNDVWVFDPAAGEHGEWAWMGGNTTVLCSGADCTGRPGIYGTEYQFDSANLPGSRVSGSTWTDGNGNLWLLGGYGLDAVGTYGDSSDLWEFRFSGAPQSITFPAPGSPVTYGAAPMTLSAMATSGLPVTFSAVSGGGEVSGTNGSMLTISGAGPLVIAANQAGDSTYEPALQVTQTITVKRALLKVVAENKTMKAGGPMPNLTWHPSGFVNGDKIATALTGWPVLTTDATPTSPPGTYRIHITFGTLAAKNYGFQFIGGTLTVKP